MCLEEVISECVRIRATSKLQQLKDSLTGTVWEQRGSATQSSASHGSVYVCDCMIIQSNSQELYIYTVFVMFVVECCHFRGILFCCSTAVYRAAVSACACTWESGRV